MYRSVEEFMKYVKEKNPGQPEFHQAVLEVMESIWPVIEKNPKYQEANILEKGGEAPLVVVHQQHAPSARLREALCPLQQLHSFS